MIINSEGRKFIQNVIVKCNCGGNQSVACGVCEVMKRQEFPSCIAHNHGSADQSAK